MIRIIATSTVALSLALATTALAGPNNPTNARAMAAALSTGINQDQATKDAVESLGFTPKNPNAAVPSMVSGGGNGGWGNIGSTLTSPDGSSVSGR